MDHRTTGHGRRLERSIVVYQSLLDPTKAEKVGSESFLVADPHQLTESNPSKKMVVELVERFAQIYPTTEPDTQNPTAYDSGVVLKMVATEALKVAKPGSEEFRLAIRDRLHTISGLIGSVGVYEFKPGEPYGVQSNSLVLATVKGGKWIYLGD